MARKWDAYNATALVDDVIQVLREKGIDFDVNDGTDVERWRAASRLLANLGVIATMPPEKSLDLDGHMSYNRRIHGD